MKKGASLRVRLGLELVPGVCAGEIAALLRFFALDAFAGVTVGVACSALAVALLAELGRLYTLFDFPRGSSTWVCPTATSDLSLGLESAGLM